MKKSKLTLVKESIKKGSKGWLNKYKCECGNTTLQYPYNVKCGIVRTCGCGRWKIKNTIPKNSLLTFIGKTKNRINKHICNKYKCRCGSVVIKMGVLVRNGATKSCGCLKKNFIPSNKKHYVQPKDSKLTLIKLNVKRYKNGWLCKYKCECGKTKLVRKSHVMSGSTKSCGCSTNKFIKPFITTHGLTKTRIYRIWVSMRRRCREKKNYAGRGIRVCRKWKNNFLPFYEWSMKNGYTDKLQIDRKNNNGNYEPSNCQWTTIKVNANNRRSNLGIKKIKAIKSLLSKGFLPSQVRKKLGYGAVSHIRHIAKGKFHSDIVVNS